MSRLPVIIAQGGTAAPRYTEEDWGSTRRLVRQAGQLAEKSFDIAEHEQNLRRTVQLSEKAAGITRQLDEYRTELDSDPDYKTKAQRFNARARELIEADAGTMDRTTAAAFRARVEPMSASMEMTVRHGARRDEIDEAKVKLLQTNDDLLTRASTARNDVERQGYLAQVQANIDDAQKVGILTGAQHRDQSRSTVSRFQEAQAMGLVRTNPAAALAALGDPARFTMLDPTRREYWKWQAQAKLEAHGAEARANARFEGADLQASLAKGILPEDYDTRLKIVEAGNPRLAQRIREAKTGLDAAEASLRLPLDQQRERIIALQGKEDDKGLNRTERLEYLTLRQAYAQAQKGFQEDPYLQSVRSNPTVGILLDAASQDPKMRLYAADAALETQEKNGVPEFARAVMSKPQVKQAVAELAALSGPQLDNRLRALKQEWGHLWPVLARQLREEGKLDNKIPGIETMLELPDTPQGRAAAANLAEAGKMNEEQLRKLFPVDADLKSLRQKVEEGLGDFRSSLANAPGGGPVIARYVDDVTKRAALLKAGNPNLGTSEAVQRATAELIGNHYRFIPGDNGAIVRVPRALDDRAVDVDAVRENLIAGKRKLGELDLQVPMNPVPGANAAKDKAAFVKRLEAYGIWQTTADSRGAVLMYEANGRLQPVMVKGKPFVVPFDAPANVFKMPRAEDVFDPGTGMPTGRGREPAPAIQRIGGEGAQVPANPESDFGERLRASGTPESTNIVDDYLTDKELEAWNERTERWVKKGRLKERHESVRNGNIIDVVTKFEPARSTDTKAIEHLRRRYPGWPDSYQNRGSPR